MKCLPLQELDWFVFLFYGKECPLQVMRMILMHFTK